MRALGADRTRGRRALAQGRLATRARGLRRGRRASAPAATDSSIWSLRLCMGWLMHTKSHASIAISTPPVNSYFVWVTPLWRRSRASGGCHASCAGGGHDPNEQTPRARSLPADGGRNLFHSPRSRVSRGGPLRHHPEEPATAPMWQAAPRLNPRKQTAAAPDVPSHPPTHTRLGACGEAALRERPPATPPIDAQRSHVQGRRPPESDPPGRFSSPRQAQTAL